MAIKDYIKSVQDKILLSKKESRLYFTVPYIFDIRNRIFSIDKIFSEFKHSNYSRINYNNLILKCHKFVLLKQTKLINLSKLFSYKIVRIKIFKGNESKKSFIINMLLDKILQYMFLHLLDVLVEENIKAGVFTYRKNSDARVAVASVYKELNRVKYIDQMCLCSVSIKKYSDRLYQMQIMKQYIFPKSYNFLLFRWLIFYSASKNNNFKSLDKVNNVIFLNFILNPSIENLLLSNTFPKNVLKKKGKNKQKIWANIFFYGDDIVLIANNPILFYHYLIKLKKNLKKIGLLLNVKKMKFFVCIKSKIKFQFLGFEFLIIPKSQLKKSSLFFNIKKVHFSKKILKVSIL